MSSDTRRLSDADLVAQIESAGEVPKKIVNEYYRRCIPLYLDFLGTHWHTGFYLDDDNDISSLDQVRMIDHLAALADLSAGISVLDVGCGIGATAIHLSQRYAVNAIGLTPVAEQKKMADYLAKQKGTSVQIDIGHAESLPYPDSSIDVIMFFESACHFEDRAAFFTEAYRVLKPGGRLLGEDWMSADGLNCEAQNRLISDICKTWAIPKLGTSEEYQQLMSSAGLEDIDIVDMRSLMPLHRGFAINDTDQQELQHDIARCTEPLLQLTLKGIASLGKAYAADVFTIAQFSASKPDEDTRC